MPRIVLVVVVLLVAGVVGFALWGTRGGGHAIAPVGGREPRELAETVDAPVPVGGALEGPERTAVAPAEAEPPATAAGAQARTDEVGLSGTIVVLDASGTEHPSEDGRLWLVARRGRVGSGREVEVRAGAWRATVPLGATLGVDSLELAGRPALLEELGATFALPANRVLELRARWMLATRLRVRDAGTDSDLDDVRLVRAEGWPRAECPHPGLVTAGRVVLEGARSPIELAPTPERLQRLHVHSPGYAWQRVDLDAREGGERVVLLQPGGDLEVEILGDVRDAGTLLRVRGKTYAPTVDLELGRRRHFVLEGLPAGPMRVSAEIGNWWEEPAVLAREELELRAGERARALLTLEPPPSAASVTLGGEIVIPPAWELERFLLVVKLLDTPLAGHERIVRLSSDGLDPDPGRPGVWGWRLDDAQAGRYELELHPLYTSISLEVGPAGNEGILFEIPAPGAVSVRVLDALTGEDARVDGVFWNSKRPAWVGGGGIAPAEHDAATGRWTLRAPQGELEIHVRGRGYRELQDSARLGPAPLELVLRVEPVFQVELELAYQGAVVAWPAETLVTARLVGGVGSERSAYSSGGRRCRLALETPGTWRVDVPRIAGFAPIPSQEIDVGSARVVRHVIELVREP